MFAELHLESRAVSLVYQYVGISTMALSTLLSQHIHTCIAWATLFPLLSLYTFTNTPVSPEMGIKTLPREFWSHPYQA